MGQMKKPTNHTKCEIISIHLPIIILIIMHILIIRLIHIIISITDMEKLPSSLAALAEIFRKLAEIRTFF